MPSYQAPLADLDYLLYDVFAIEKHWQALPGCDDLDRDTAQAILREVGKLCEQELFPLNQLGDEQGCQWCEGDVITPPGFKDAYQAFCEGGWNGLSGDSEYGAMGMPKSLVACIDEMVQGSCMAFGLAPMLTAGASLAIAAHASDKLKAMYLPHLYSGRWSGAMDLTEPHAGTDLGLIKTKACLNSDGSYDIRGTKIFITWGEHDMAENIVHLVLAKLPDAPAGAKGISMFLVPKYIPTENGELGLPNKLSCGSLEKKMGIKASATCVMNFDGAQGWLVGEANRGLAAMFTMMNYERLVVGIQGLAVADASYQNARDYAKQRLQGRSVGGVQYADKDADNLLVHADVRRMLMEMKALNEGGRAFYIYLAKWLDLTKSDNIAIAKQAQSRVDLLTPVCKAFLTDNALSTTVNGQQVLGGHGYIREWGLEQFVRDVRIAQIYEGTNGIQAMDLISRKTMLENGRLVQDYVHEIRGFIDAKHQYSSQNLTELLRAADMLLEATAFILSQADKDAHLPGAIACDYLTLLGWVSLGYMWGQSDVCIAQLPRETREHNGPFYHAKLATSHFFFQRQLCEIESIIVRIRAGSQVIMSLSDDQF